MHMQYSLFKNSTSHIQINNFSLFQISQIPIGCIATCELWLFRDFSVLASYEVISHLVVLKHETGLVLFFVFDLSASSSAGLFLSSIHFSSRCFGR